MTSNLIDIGSSTYYIRYLAEIGSGVFFPSTSSDYDYLITAKHNLALKDFQTFNEKNLNEIIAKKNPSDSAAIKIIKAVFHPSKDLAILIIPKQNNKALSIKSLTGIMHGTDATLCGFNQDIRRTILGTFVDIGDENFFEIHLNTDIEYQQPNNTGEYFADIYFRGLSGGGVFNTNGLMLQGILLSLSDKKADLKILKCLSLKPVNNLLKQNGLARMKVMSNIEYFSEDELRRFNVTSRREFFPAPPEFENISYTLPREQHEEILKTILDTQGPVIIKAEGGVGKSVFVRQLQDSLPENSIGVVFDCFGGGKYRNRSETRHEPSQALTQIVNELAYQELCSPIINDGTYDDRSLMKSFIYRLKSVHEKINEENPNSRLVIFIDAADNAEVAAKEFSEECFVHQILREELPAGCHLVALSRPERISLLQASENILMVELRPFSEAETVKHLRSYFPQATLENAHEFHRLTGGNPRVQANAIAFNEDSLNEVLKNLGQYSLYGLTVEKQIESLLTRAISQVKEKFSITEQKQIDAICIGLATLQPFIPLEVLAEVAEVEISLIKSLVSDLGRPLWLTDDAVQFRDEPTEKWFQDKFSASAAQIKSYIALLNPLASKYTYVAEVLPVLYLKAEMYDELVNLALSDNFLPEDNPLDRRNVRVFRLQFAFRAALNAKNYKDASKIALRAGEEAASNHRQLEILSKNIDLITALQSRQKIQELAHRQTLKGEWTGSGNVFAASLLSAYPEYKGEAYSYFRAANTWLGIYFKERKHTDDPNFSRRLKIEEIIELSYANLNLYGPKAFVKSVESWLPVSLIFQITRGVALRLVDNGEYSKIDSIAKLGCYNVYVLFAIADVLMTLGKHAPKLALKRCLKTLQKKRSISIELYLSDFDYDISIGNAMLSFAESCVAMGFRQKKVLKFLLQHFPRKVSHLVSDRHHSGGRNFFLRGFALIAHLSGNTNTTATNILISIFRKKNWFERISGNEALVWTVERMLPWYFVRIRTLFGMVSDLSDAFSKAYTASVKTSHSVYFPDDHLIPEISRLCFESMIFCEKISKEILIELYEKYCPEGSFQIEDQIFALKASYHLHHLLGLRQAIEKSCNSEIVRNSDQSSTEAKAEYYIKISRSMLSTHKDNASVYLDDAIEVLSKFGDELFSRWMAVVDIAKFLSNQSAISNELLYRFMRCAEFVGQQFDREKHFNRSEVLKICAHQSVQFAFATLSRWRERLVGRPWELINTLARETLKLNALSPSAVWALSGIEGCFQDARFAEDCIEAAQSVSLKQQIFDFTIRDLLLSTESQRELEYLKAASEKFDLQNKDFNSFISITSGSLNVQVSAVEMLGTNNVWQKKIDWSCIFDSTQSYDEDWLKNSLKKFRDLKDEVNEHDFWTEMFNLVQDGHESRFLNSLVTAEIMQFFDLLRAFSCVPTSWLNQASVKKNLPKMLQSIARRYPEMLADRHMAEYFLKDIKTTSALDIKPIHLGLLEGFAQSSKMLSAETFFGVVNAVNSFITKEEALEVLDYAITRFEEYNSDDFADGPWAEWLIPPSNMLEALAGYLWSALGSPQSTVRWQAAHSVRRLADLACEKELSALIDWIYEDSARAFCARKYPFYHLHARLYLLIALARIVIDHPRILLPHHEKFLQLALYREPHILIQIFSANIALNLEQAQPGTYKPDIVVNLNAVGKSSLPYLELDCDHSRVDSPWHEQGQIDLSQRLKFGIDFPSGWLDPLGDVFGIPMKQIEELVSQVVINDWQIQIENSCINDPRTELWRTRHFREEIRYRDSSYPRTDVYSFYLGYHGMMNVASKLLNAIPVIRQKEGWQSKEWDGWLKGHLLTRADGRWLADRRDTMPIERRQWVYETASTEWIDQVTNEDLLDGLLFGQQGETWLYTGGHWVDIEHNREEHYYITSALVSEETAESLLYALSTSQNNHDYSLPDYDDEMEIEEPPFILKGWIQDGEVLQRLDKFDLHAAKVDYPPLTVSSPIVEHFDLKTDCDQREWFLPHEKKACLRSEVWCDEPPQDRDQTIRHGSRFGASLSFLQRLCEETQQSIIIEVELDRYLSDPYTRRNYGTRENHKAHKVYLLYRDGVLRDTESRYYLREAVGEGS